AVVRALDDGRLRLAGGGPVHAAAADLEAGGGDHVVQAHGARARAEVAGHVLRGTAPLQTLPGIGVEGLGAAGRSGRVHARHPRVAEQAQDGLVAAVAVHRVVVEIAGDHEAGVGRQAAAAALVVAQPGLVAGGDVLLPQADLVGVARAVAVLRAVEHRRGGVRD